MFRYLPKFLVIASALLATRYSGHCSPISLRPIQIQTRGSVVFNSRQALIVVPENTLMNPIQRTRIFLVCGSSPSQTLASDGLTVLGFGKFLGGYQLEIINRTNDSYRCYYIPRSTTPSFHLSADVFRCNTLTTNLALQRFNTHFLLVDNLVITRSESYTLQVARLPH